MVSSCTCRQPGVAVSLVTSHLPLYRRVMRTETTLSPNDALLRIESLSSDDALQLILRLKQGRNVIFGAELFSVGRLRLVQGAVQIFEDIERTGESVVRFLRGSPGVGKTNFSGRLFHAG